MADRLNRARRNWRVAAIVLTSTTVVAAGPPNHAGDATEWVRGREARVYYGYHHRAAVEAMGVDLELDPAFANLLGLGERRHNPTSARRAALKALLDHPADEAVRLLASAVVIDAVRSFVANAELYHLQRRMGSLSYADSALLAARAGAIDRALFGRGVLAMIELDTDGSPVNWEASRVMLGEQLDEAKNGRQINAVWRETHNELQAYPPYAANAKQLAEFWRTGPARAGRGGSGERVVAPGADMQRSSRYPGPSLERLTGVKWRQEFDARLRGQPAVDKTHVYAILAGRFRWEGSRVVAMDRRTRTVQWTLTAPARGFSLTLVGNRLYLSSSDPGQSPAFLQAIDATIGEQIWVYQAPGGTDNQLSSPVVDVTTVFVADRFGTIRALDVADGTLRWEVEDGSVRLNVTPTPALADGTVIVPREDALLAVNAEDGVTRWKIDVPSGDGSVSIGKGRVLVGHRSLLAVDLRDGQLLWRFDPPDATGLFRGAPALMGDAIIARDSRTVYALDGRTGAQVWSKTMPQPLDWNVAPVTCERTVYVGTEGSMDAGSTLFALDAMSGEVRWTFDLDDRLYGAAPVIADQTLFLNSGHDILALE